MRFGTHISGAGGIEKIPQKAKDLGCDTFQFFSRSPRGGKSVLADSVAEAFKTSAKKLGFTHYYIHAPYYINLASTEARIYNGSVEILRDELLRAEKLGARGIITHIGSAKDMTHTEALERVIAGVGKIVADVPSTLFLEISAGAGDIIGATLEELARTRLHRGTTFAQRRGLVPCSTSTINFSALKTWRLFIQTIQKWALASAKTGTNTSGKANWDLRRFGFL